MGWLAVIKAVLPHAGTIVNLAGPAFTKLANREQSALRPELLEQQIAELQTAATQNAEHIRDLAGQLQDTAKALEQAMLDAEARVRRAQAFASIAIALSLASLGTVLLLLLGR